MKIRALKSLLFAVAAQGLLQLPWFGPTPAYAEAFEVVDANDTVLGPVVGIRQMGAGETGYFFAFDLGGQSALLLADNRLQIKSADLSELYVYYAAANCEGAPLVSDVLSTTAMNLPVYPAANDLWLVDNTTTISPLVAGKRHIGSTNPLVVCEPLTPQNKTGNPLSLFGTLTFTPPLRIVRTPFLFGDDFSSGTPEAWSNF